MYIVQNNIVIMGTCLLLPHLHTVYTMCYNYDGNFYVQLQNVQIKVNIYNNM